MRFTVAKYETIEEIISVPAKVGLIPGRAFSSKYKFNKDGFFISYKFKCAEPDITVALMKDNVPLKNLIFEGDYPTEKNLSMGEGSEVMFQIENNSAAPVSIAVYGLLFEEE